MIFRPEVGLVYFNIDSVCDGILNRVHAATPLPKLVVLDLSAAPRVDMQGAHTLAAMATELTGRGIRFQAVEPRSSVRDRVRQERVDAKLGGVNRFTTVADVVEHFQREQEAFSRNFETSVAFGVSKQGDGSPRPNREH
jgi:MFS superfamily sulfate permease-like transporter